MDDLLVRLVDVVLDLPSDIDHQPMFTRGCWRFQYTRHVSFTSEPGGTFQQAMQYALRFAYDEGYMFLRIRQHTPGGESDVES